MKNIKKRILLTNEFSGLNTGYSVYGYSLMNYLVSTGKYELAELACYADPDSPNIQEMSKSLKWKVYFNQPPSKPEGEFQRFSSRQTNSFGEWGFETVCIDFKPHICIDIRDFWFQDFIERSPFRKYFHRIWMPTVDAMPQHPQWVSSMKSADAIFTYTDWAKDSISKEYGIKTISSVSPGVELDVFQPIDHRFKNQHKIELGLPENSFIIGMASRSQKRKLFPQLIEAFAEFLEISPINISRKCYLCLHTSYPDWWEFPYYLNKYGVTARVYFTYKCSECKYFFTSLFQDARTTCVKCGKNSACIPNTHIGLERNEVSLIMNSFDVYVQYANSEGFGICQIEAAACGLPVFATDYSAMSDVVRKLKGFPIKVDRLTSEGETGCNRAIPSNADFIEKLSKFLQLPEEMRLRKGTESRKMAEKYYDFKNIGHIWENYLDTVDVEQLDKTWYFPANIINIPQNVSDILTISNNESFVRYLIEDILKRPDLSDSYLAIRLLRDLNSGVTHESINDMFFHELSAIGTSSKRRVFGRVDALNEIIKIANHFNKWEDLRWKTIQ